MPAFLACGADAPALDMGIDVRNGEFRIREMVAKERGRRYVRYQLVGYLNGERVRKRFESHDEAIGEKRRLEVLAANTGEIRAANTRLSHEQLAESEAAFARLAGRSLTQAVDWYLSTYHKAHAEKSLLDAANSFLKDREPHVSAPAFRDYRRTMRDFVAFFSQRVAVSTLPFIHVDKARVVHVDNEQAEARIPDHGPANSPLVHTITTDDVESFLRSFDVGPKRFNNLRADLHAFFNFCVARPRQWIRENPVTPIAQFKIARGLPEIISEVRAAELMAYVEGYKGGERCKMRRGGLVPYFALCLFAGLRPSVEDGEIRKLAEHKDVTRLIDLQLGVVRITPEISKINAVRQVKIRSNLKAWLQRYPIDKFPIIVPNMEGHLAAIRKRFELGSDVARHTFISMHVAAFKSLGEAALEAGNSEAIIRRHYYNTVDEKAAARFWKIRPTR